jgi:lipoate---protein ligase
MKFIGNRGITKPQLNLAFEEYVLKHVPAEDDYLLFYINEPSIIIGRNQNTIEEINSDYVEKNGIHVVRRLSGGGAVYHDLGNLNFSFVTNEDKESFHNFSKFTEPVVQVLRSMGVQAELTGRNDIQVGERKISGNAQYKYKGRMYSHGTLMFRSELDHVVDALQVNKAKIESKGIKSIRSRVANISEFLDQPMTIEEFRERLLRGIFGQEDIPEYRLTDGDWEEIGKLADRRYANWDWNYGKSPRSNFSNSVRIEGVGTIDVRLSIEHGYIREAKIYGDFFGGGDVDELAGMLKGAIYYRNSLERLLQSVDIDHYIGRLDREAFLNLLLE